MAESDFFIKKDIEAPSLLVEPPLSPNSAIEVLNNLQQQSQKNKTFNFFLVLYGFFVSPALISLVEELSNPPIKGTSIIPIKPSPLGLLIFIGLLVVMYASVRVLLT